MDEQRNESNRPANPRRRKRSKMQIFKETYLPVVIAGVALLLIVIFAIGSITRGVQKRQAEKQAAIEESLAQEQEQQRLQMQAFELIAQAEQLASSYDYHAAISTIDMFEGDISSFPELSAMREELEHEQSQLVEWNDPNQIYNLSFQLLIADAQRAFSHPTYGFSFNRNFITTSEFSSILQQLFENGYILVSRDDFIDTSFNEEGNPVYTAKPIYLPNGKKPIMLTQTNVNYNIYLVDSDGDKMPDQNGGGFAHKLVYDPVANTFYNEMIDSEGQAVTGAFDMIPILEDFIKQHPSFSYKGARATIALTGYNGLFGHRTHADAREEFGEDAYQSAVSEAQSVANALVDCGYDLAFYSYENIPYGESTVAQIQEDISNWEAEAVPLIGTLDTMVYAQMQDITAEQTYSGEKYETLKNAGFRYYMGFSMDGKPWTYITDDYIRQGRIMVTGANLAHHSDWFATLFDSAMVLESSRGNVPE